MRKVRNEAPEPPSEKTAPTPGVCVVTPWAGVCQIQHRPSQRNRQGCGNASPVQAPSISVPVFKNNLAFLGSVHDFKTIENV